MEPANYLRLRAEEIIEQAVAPSAPGSQPERAVAGFRHLVGAAMALHGAGLIAAPEADAVIAEAADALAVRGVDWLLTGLGAPELTQLHHTAGPGPPERLQRVVAVGRTLSPQPAPGRAPRPARRPEEAAEVSLVLTSVEVWADRGIVRLVDGGGAASDWELWPAPGPQDMAMTVELTLGRPVDVVLAEGAATAPLGARASRAGAGTYLEWLAWQQLAEVRRLPTIEVMNEARGRVESASAAFSALELAAGQGWPVDAGAAFHAALLGACLVDPGPSDAPAAPVPPAWSRIVGSPAVPAGLREVLPVAGRLPDDAGGWTLTSVEDWVDHWRLVAVGFPTSPGCVWAAVDDAGSAYGGSVAGPSAIRFDPGLGDGWSSLTVSVVDAGEVVSIEVRR